MDEKKLTRGWTAEENARFMHLKKQGSTMFQIAMALGKTEGAVKQHYRHLFALKNPEARIEPEGKYIIKKTDFEDSVVTTYMEVDIKFFGNSSKAWNYTMDVIKASNAKAKEAKIPVVYWVKYK